MIDFLIIGGGIAGLSSGARLSVHGSVTVLEGESALGYHSSGRSAAMFEENYGPPPTVELSRASADFFETHKGGYLSARGFMLLAKSHQHDAFISDMTELDLQPILLDQAFDMVPILNPETVVSAALHDAASDIDTDRLLQDFARDIRGAGGQVLTGNPVSEISHQGRWRVQAGEVFEARVLVNAAGAWADQIAVMAGLPPVGLTPRRRSIAQLPAPGGRDVSSWPMLMGVGESWYAKPSAGKWLVSPADADPVEPHDAFADDLVLAEGLARYEEMVTTPVTRLETSWAGLRSFSPDGNLVLGPDPTNPSFVWSAGQGGYGFQTAPAASQLVADLVTGNAPELPTEVISVLQPDRLRQS
ncbi:MAG: FAD-dependent oxidoreductase [Pseudomonadota bacterium]